MAWQYHRDVKVILDEIAPNLHWLGLDCLMRRGHQVKRTQPWVCSAVC